MDLFGFGSLLNGTVGFLLSHAGYSGHRHVVVVVIASVWTLFLVRAVFGLGRQVVGMDTT